MKWWLLFAVALAVLCIGAFYLIENRRARDTDQRIGEAKSTYLILQSKIKERVKLKMLTEESYKDKLSPLLEESKQTIFAADLADQAHNKGAVDEKLEAAREQMRSIEDRVGINHDAIYGTRDIK